MLTKLPKHPGDFATILEDLGNPSAAQIARALGVSRRTVERWKKTGAPRTALLSLWWLSREGHSFWDCEMHERTRLAIEQNRALWRHIGELNRKIAQLEASKGLEYAVNRPACLPVATASTVARLERHRATA